MAKRVIPRAMFQPLEGLTMAELCDTESLVNLTKQETYPAIEEAFNNKKTFATLFEINVTGYYIDIPKRSWVDALEELIKYNLTEEKFEECTKIKQLIDKIRQPIKVKPKNIADGEGTIRDTASN